jgi:hypothetical protein
VVKLFLKSQNFKVWPECGKSSDKCQYLQPNNAQTLQTMNAGLGVPVKLLHESLGHIVTVELKTGQLYRGKLAEGALQFRSRSQFVADASCCAFF